MRNLVLLFVAFLSACYTVNAQSIPDWTRVLQTTTYSYPAGRIITADAGHVYMAGNISGPVTFAETQYTSSELNDMIIFKLSTTGAVTWAKQFSAQSTGTLYPTALKVDNNHNVYVVGTFTGTATFGSHTITSTATVNAFIARLDSDGNASWATAFAATGSGISKLVFDESGNTYLISKTASLIKFNNAGSLEWEQKYPDRTLQAIAVYGPHLFIGGALQSGTIKFGRFNLLATNAYNTGFLARANLDGEFNNTLIAGPSNSTKEGDYHAVGTFTHPTTGLRNFDLQKTITGVDENVLTTTVGDMGSGTVILTINPDSSVAISGSTGSSSVIQSGINKYDPVTKAFTLNYSYTAATGTRVISEVLTLTSPPNYAGDGTSVADFATDNEGNILLTGGYTKFLKLGSLSLSNLATSHYTYIAKCDSNFVFAWAKSSDAIETTREMFAFRLFQDNLNNIYEYGLSSQGATTFTYGSVSVVQQPQFLFKFDTNGEPLAGYGFQTTMFSRIFVEPEGKIAITGPVDNDGISQYGNFYIAQYNNNMSTDWKKNSSNHQAGTTEINYVKHDTSGNTYLQVRIRGYCNFFGTLIRSNLGTTINAKFDKSGNVLWINQIDDSPVGLIYGPRFSLDKDGHLLTVGSFKTTLTVGSQNLINTNAFDDGYIVKYDPNGQVLWTTQLTTDGTHSIFGVTSDKEGNVIVSGEFKNMLTAGNKTIDAGAVDGAFVIKLDGAGNCLWANGYPIGNTVYSAMPATDENNNIYLAGEMYNFTTGQLVFGSITAPQTSNDGGTVLVKFNPEGIPQWAYTYGSGTVNGPDGWPTDIKTDTAGNVILLGYCGNNAKFGSATLTNTIGNSYSYYLAKINTNGEVTWADAVYHKSPSYRYGDLLDVDKSGNIYIGGHFKDAIVIQGTTYTPAGTNDFFAAKYSNDGVFKWIKVMPANSAGISAISVEGEDVLSICGIAGKDPALGDFTIDRKGGSTWIIATLGVIEPTPNTLFVDATEGSEITFTFYSNADWTVSIDQEWLTVNTNSGTGGTTLLFTAEANNTGEPRTATVTITFPGTKAQSITVTIVQEISTVGLAELTDRKILVYPNPSRDYLLLNTAVTGDMVYIFDLNGKMIIREQIGGNKINISSLQKGVYTLKMDCKTGILVKKFVKL